MDRQELIDKIQSVKNINKEVNKIYEVLDALGISYKRTSCNRCRKDLMNIAMEALGLIESAADESAFNDVPETGYEWRYVRKAPVWCDGVTYSQSTDPKLIEKFVNRFPRGYYEKVAVEQHIEEITEE